MKIRIKGNSIRYRMTRSEVEKFCETGIFAEQTQFAGTVFNYAIKTYNGNDVLHATLENNTITLYLSTKEANSWAESDRVGFQSIMKLPDKTELHLLLEKDFACLDNVSEDQSDNYPNPKAGMGC